MYRSIPKSNFNNNFILVGANINSLPYRSNINTYAGLPEDITNPLSYVGSANYTYSSISDIDTRSQLKIKLIPEGSAEMGQVMNPQYYGGMSIMSLDGLISPVSFYPSRWCSTFSTTLYSRSSCPWCNGLGTIQNNKTTDDDINNYPKEKSLGSSPCPYCIQDGDKEKEREKTVSASPEIDPPYIITSSNDADTNPISNTVSPGNSALVNKFTLNPIVMRQGEFSNPDNRQSGDTSAHCIDVVGAGLTPPENGDSCRSLVGGTNNNFKSEFNQRFMSLRGPVMLHSWGYDTKGYPVPNESGEFKLNNGVLVKDDLGNPVYKTQEPDGSESGYSDPTPTNKFRKGWAQLAHSWPVGPIDFRWDAEAGVWTMGGIYKNVWITLETDLTQKNTVVRGSMFQEGPTTLPNGQRKTVFVKDTLGVVSAPRKATLYCKYDSDNGFYQPLHSMPLATSGNINSSNSADIYSSYSIDDNEKNKSYTTSFLNPLSLPTDRNIGLFTYINGDWVLTSVKNQ